MKKHLKFFCISIILIILLVGIFIYKVFGKESSNNEQNNKTLSELKNIENKFQNIFNQLNNISFEKYTISSTEIKKEEDNSSSKSSESEQSKEKSKSKSSEESMKNDESSQDNKKFELQENTILTKNSNINWKQIKTDIENTYVLLYQCTLDLYKITENKEDIINFNKQYDKLTMSVKKEDKNGTLKELSILYDYLAKFIDNCSNDEKEITIIKTKNNIFKAYSILDDEDWIKMKDYINHAIYEYSKIMKSNNNNEYAINKANIILNDIQNAIDLKDKEVFLIKYKNVLEEFKNI